MGTSSGLVFCKFKEKDHPHACGDKVCENYYVGDGVGSSPRVWGQVGLDIWYQFDSRIIPTRVGTRLLLRRSALRQRDHPHACGDKVKVTLTNCLITGSSPRVWGQVSPFFS